jgi:hypothetical protein
MRLGYAGEAQGGAAGRHPSLCVCLLPRGSSCSRCFLLAHLLLL